MSSTRASTSGSGGHRPSFPQRASLDCLILQSQLAQPPARAIACRLVRDQVASQSPQLGTRAVNTLDYPARKHRECAYLQGSYFPQARGNVGPVSVRILRAIIRHRSFASRRSLVNTPRQTVPPIVTGRASLCLSNASMLQSPSSPTAEVTIILAISLSARPQGRGDPAESHGRRRALRDTCSRVRTALSFSSRHLGSGSLSDPKTSCRRPSPSLLRKVRPRRRRSNFRDLGPSRGRAFFWGAGEKPRRSLLGSG